MVNHLGKEMSRRRRRRRNLELLGKIMRNSNRVKAEGVDKYRHRRLILSNLIVRNLCGIGWNRDGYCQGSVGPRKVNLLKD